MKKFFGDGEHDFKLTFDLAHAFERDNRKSMYGVMRALSTSDWRVNDVSEVIRLALIGGGMDDVKAFALVDTYVKIKPLAQSAVLAGEILEGAYLGEEDPAKVEADRVFGKTDEYGNAV